MNTLEDLEREFNFILSELYKQLYADKMLDWGSDGNGWYTNVFPTLKENPPLPCLEVISKFWDPIVYHNGIREIINHEAVRYQSQIPNGSSGKKRCRRFVCFPIGYGE